MRRNHGLRYHPLYGTWSNMMSRCYNPNVKSYRDYGARGITVCERWHNPQLFIEDIERLIGPRPPGMTLDRIRNNEGYGPGNVCWNDRRGQVRNSRRFVDGQRSGAVYQLWYRLMHRCPDEVCLEWQDFASFAAGINQLLGPRPAGLRFDRIDDRLPYGPGNVAWITGAEQVRRAQAARWAR
jgi:hypothetical protein